MEMLLHILIIASVINLHAAATANPRNEEPTCYSRYDYDYKLMQALTELQNEQKVLKTTVNEQATTISALQDELKETAVNQWGDWSSWSKCIFKCSSSKEGRQQTRERARVQTGGGTTTEKESRPCNAVQYAGCIKDDGPEDQYGVTYDFADQVALSTCSSLPEASGHIYAIRRQCSNLAVSCEETCKGLELNCFNSLHVYKGSPTQDRNDVGKLGLYLYRYNACGGGCGPNFCCCKK